MRPPTLLFAIARDRRHIASSISAAAVNGSIRVTSSVSAPRRMLVDSGPLDELLVRRAALLVTAVIGGIGIALLVGNVGLWQAHGGEDLAIYLSHVRRWLAGGSYYAPWQLAGPYEHTNPDSLYPPPFALFMLPWLVLPAFLWWLAPGLIIAAAIRRLAPRPWVWPLLAVCCADGRSLGLILWGNSSMWIAAALAAACAWRAPTALFAILKPTLAPLAFVGAHSRAWWLVAGALTVISLLLLPAWPDYARAMSNLRDQNLTYSLMDLPLCLVGPIAWIGRASRQGRQEPT